VCACVRVRVRAYARACVRVHGHATSKISLKAPTSPGRSCFIDAQCDRACARQHAWLCLGFFRELINGNQSPQSTHVDCFKKRERGRHRERETDRERETERETLNPSNSFPFACTSSCAPEEQQLAFSPWVGGCFAHHRRWRTDGGVGRRVEEKRWRRRSWWRSGWRHVARTGGGGGAGWRRDDTSGDGRWEGGSGRFSFSLFFFSLPFLVPLWFEPFWALTGGVDVHRDAKQGKQ